MENEPATDEQYVQIGKRIRQAREEAHMTQAALAIALEFQSPTAISLIEDGKRRIKLSDIQKVANILGQDLTYLMTGTHPQQNVSVSTALRADKELTGKDVQQIESFINFVKHQQNGRRNDQ